MSPSRDASTAAPGRDGAGGTQPVEMWRSLLRAAIVVAFALRAVISLLDAQSIASGAIRTPPLVSSLTFGSPSPLWPLIWGVLSVVVAGSLALRVRVGWLLALAVSVAYLVAGISDVSMLAEAGEADGWQLVMSALIGVVVPTAVLACLVAIRGWYLPSSRPLPHVHLHVHERRAEPATAPASTLERWRRR